MPEPDTDPNVTPQFLHEVASILTRAQQLTQSIRALAESAERAQLLSEGAWSGNGPGKDAGTPRDEVRKVLSPTWEKAVEDLEAAVASLPR